MRSPWRPVKRQETLKRSPARKI